MQYWLHWLQLSTADDFEFVFQLNKTNMRPYVEQMRGWNDQAERLAMQQQFHPGCDQIIMIDGKEAGIFGVDRHASEIQLRHIEILPEYQRLGVGTALIRSLLHEAQQAKLPVRLTVLKVNPARRLYSRLGFRIAGETESKYHMAAIVEDETQ